MTKKSLKSIRTLASESKARRKTPLTPEQVERLNKIFEEIEREHRSSLMRDLAPGLTLDD